MLEVNMKINGNTFVHIYGHNTGEYIKDNKMEYYYELHDIGKNTPVVSGLVSHHREEGLTKLVYLILKKTVKGEEKK